MGRVKNVNVGGTNYEFQDGDVGSLADLSTRNKNNIVEAVNEVKADSSEVVTLLEFTKVSASSTYSLSESYNNFKKVCVKLTLFNDTTKNVADFVEIPTSVVSASSNLIAKRLAIADTRYAYVQCGFSSNTKLGVGAISIIGGDNVYITVYGVGRK